MSASPESKDELMPLRRSSRKSVAPKADDLVLTPKKRKSTATPIKNVQEKVSEAVRKTRGTPRKSVLSTQNDDTPKKKEINTPRKSTVNETSPKETNKRTPRKSTLVETSPTAVLKETNKRTPRRSTAVDNSQIGTPKESARRASRRSMAVETSPTGETKETNKRTPRKSLWNSKETNENEQPSIKEETSEIPATTKGRRKSVAVKKMSPDTSPEEDSKDIESKTVSVEEALNQSPKKKSRKSVHFKKEVDEHQLEPESDNFSSPSPTRTISNPINSHAPETGIQSTLALVPRICLTDIKPILKEANLAEFIKIQTATQLGDVPGVFENQVPTESSLDSLLMSPAKFLKSDGDESDEEEVKSSIKKIDFSKEFNGTYTEQESCESDLNSLIKNEKNASEEVCSLSQSTAKDTDLKKVESLSPKSDRSLVTKSSNCSSPIRVTTDEISGSVAIDEVPESVAIDGVPESVAIDKVSESVAIDGVPENVAIDEVPESVAIDKVSESVAIDGIPESVAIDKVSESVAIDGVPENVAIDEVPESVAIDKVSESVAIDGVPESVAIDEVPESVAIDKVSESVAIDGVPESVAIDDAPESVAIDEVSESVTIIDEVLESEINSPTQSKIELSDSFQVSTTSPTDNTSAKETVIQVGKSTFQGLESHVSSSETIKLAEENIDSSNYDKTINEEEKNLVNKKNSSFSVSSTDDVSKTIADLSEGKHSIDAPKDESSLEISNTCDDKESVTLTEQGIYNKTKSSSSNNIPIKISPSKAINTDEKTSSFQSLSTVSGVVTVEKEETDVPSAGNVTKMEEEIVQVTESIKSQILQSNKETMSLSNDDNSPSKLEEKNLINIEGSVSSTENSPIQCNLDFPKLTKADEPSLFNLDSTRVVDDTKIESTLTTKVGSHENGLDSLALDGKNNERINSSSSALDQSLHHNHDTTNLENENTNDKSKEITPASGVSSSQSDFEFSTFENKDDENDSAFDDQTVKSSPESSRLEDFSESASEVSYKQTDVDSSILASNDDNGKFNGDDSDISVKEDSESSKLINNKVSSTMNKISENSKEIISSAQSNEEPDKPGTNNVKNINVSAPASELHVDLHSSKTENNEDHKTDEPVLEIQNELRSPMISYEENSNINILASVDCDQESKMSGNEEDKIKLNSTSEEFSECNVLNHEEDGKNENPPALEYSSIVENKNNKTVNTDSQIGANEKNHIERNKDNSISEMENDLESSATININEEESVSASDVDLVTDCLKSGNEQDKNNILESTLEVQCGLVSTDIKPEEFKNTIEVSVSKNHNDHDTSNLETEENSTTEMEKESVSKDAIESENDDDNKKINDVDCDEQPANKSTTNGELNASASSSSESSPTTTSGDKNDMNTVSVSDVNIVKDCSKSDNVQDKNIILESTLEGQCGLDSTLEGQCGLDSTDIKPEEFKNTIEVSVSKNHSDHDTSNLETEENSTTKMGKESISKDVIESENDDNNEKINDDDCDEQSANESTINGELNASASSSSESSPTTTSGDKNDMNTVSASDVNIVKDCSKSDNVQDTSNILESTLEGQCGLDSSDLNPEECNTIEASVSKNHSDHDSSNLETEENSTTKMEKDSISKDVIESENDDDNEKINDVDCDEQSAIESTINSELNASTSSSSKSSPTTTSRDKKKRLQLGKRSSEADINLKAKKMKTSTGELKKSKNKNPAKEKLKMMVESFMDLEAEEGEESDLSECRDSPCDSSDSDSSVTSAFDFLQTEAKEQKTCHVGTIEELFQQSFSKDDEEEDCDWMPPKKRANVLPKLDKKRMVKKEISRNDLRLKLQKNRRKNKSCVTDKNNTEVLDTKQGTFAVTTATTVVTNKKDNRFTPKGFTVNNCAESSLSGSYIPKGFIVTRSTVEEYSDVPKKSNITKKPNLKSSGSKLDNKKFGSNTDISSNDISISRFFATAVLPCRMKEAEIKKAFSDVGINDIITVQYSTGTTALLGFSTMKSLKKSLILYGNIIYNGKPIYVLETKPQ